VIHITPARRYHNEVLGPAVLLAASSLVTLAYDRPAALPSNAIVSRWPRVAGDADLGSGARVSYELYVEPSRPLLYVITRYRVSQAGASGAENEFLIWNSQPGSREPLRCFERVAQPAAKAGEPAMWSWVVVPQGSDPYRMAMMTAVRVYAVHQELFRKQMEDVARRERP
jgi:hypothetical protein